MRTQIANLILGGATKAQILSATGIPSSQLEDLLADSSFGREIREVKEANREAEIEKKLQELELQAIKRVESNLELYDAQSLCRVLETVGRSRQMKKQQAAAPTQSPNGMINATINIALPQFLGNSQVLMDSKKQVLSIDGRNMAPLPTAQVKQLFQTIENGDSNEGSTSGATNERETAQASVGAAA